MTGSPQAFISKSRKTQDLYASSKIISELTLAAITFIYKNPFGEVVIPHLDEPYTIENNPSLPNRFIAEITSDDINSFGEGVSKAVQDRWVEIALESLNYSGININNHQKLQLINFQTSQKNAYRVQKINDELPGFYEQICNAIETYWAAVDYKSDYKTAYDELMKLMAAVKNTRIFNQINEVAARKCALDGERNALFCRKREEESDLGRPNQNVPSFLLEKAKFIEPPKTPEKGGHAAYSFNPGEAISAVSLAKRFYKYYVKDTDDPNQKIPGVRFPSTAKVALLNILKIIDDWPEAKLFKAYFDNPDREHEVVFNAQLYFEDNLSTDYLKKHGYGQFWKQNKLTLESGTIKSTSQSFQSLEAFIEELKHWQRRIREKLDQQEQDKKLKFSNYYAIVVFDGDDFGKLWSGEGARFKPDLDIHQFQQALAKQLAKFAKWIHTELGEDSYNGRVVYAGGEDFLAFVNINSLFDVLNNLRTKFKEMVSNKLQYEQDYLPTGFLMQELTFSAGIAIAHYKMPLQEVYKKAYAMEKYAKDMDGKDAFALAVLKSSGETLECRYKWLIPDSNQMTLSSLKGIIYALQDPNGFSNTFIKSLDREFRPLIIKKMNLYDKKKIFDAELIRLLKRSQTKLNNNLFEKTLHHTQNLYKSPSINIKLTNILNSLHIADFLNRQTVSNA